MKLLFNVRSFRLVALFLAVVPTFLSLALPTEIIEQLGNPPLLNLKKEETAVIVVDLQADFTEAEKGSLAVSGTTAQYVQDVIEATEFLKKEGYKIYATQDWHPEGHVSYAKTHDLPDFGIRDSKMYWPVHCLQGSKGAQILLPKKLAYTVVQKGKSKDFDSYSGFKDDNGVKTEMEALLRNEGIKNLIIYGIATDYCVNATVLDALACGFNVYVLYGLSRGVDGAGTVSALKGMKDRGAHIIPDVK